MAVSEETSNATLRHTEKTKALKKTRIEARVERSIMSGGSIGMLTAIEMLDKGVFTTALKMAEFAKHVSIDFADTRTSYGMCVR